MLRKFCTQHYHITVVESVLHMEVSEIGEMHEGREIGWL